MALRLAKARDVCSLSSISFRLASSTSTDLPFLLHKLVESVNTRFFLSQGKLGIISLLLATFNENASQNVSKIYQNMFTPVFPFRPKSALCSNNRRTLYNIQQEFPARPQSAPPTSGSTFVFTEPRIVPCVPRNDNSK